MPLTRCLAPRRRVVTPLTVLLFVLSGCTMSSPPPLDNPPLANRFACLRQRGETMVSAHRGGPDAAHAENTLAAYAALPARGISLAETDVRPSRDGVLVLSHDPNLDRVSSGAGLVADQDWAAISRARMRTRSGTLTAYPPATLPQLLAATGKDLVLQLDIKEGTRISAVLGAVEAANAGGRVIYLAYNDADIKAIAQRQPEAIVATVIPDLGKLEHLLALGIAPEHLHALFFESAIDRALFAALRARGVTVLVAATQAEETSLHESHPLDAARYRAIRDAGAQILVSDHPETATAALEGTGC